MQAINNVILTKNEIDYINNILVQHFDAEIKRHHKESRRFFGVITGLMCIVTLLDGIRSHDSVISVMFGFITIVSFVCFLFTCFQNPKKKE